MTGAMDGTGSAEVKKALHQALRKAHHARKLHAIKLLQSSYVAVSSENYSLTQVKSLGHLPAVANCGQRMVENVESISGGSEKRDSGFPSLQYIEVMFESQLMSLNSAAANLRGLVERAQIEKDACTGFIHAPRSLDPLLTALETWTKDLHFRSDELEKMLSFQVQSEVEEFFIGSDDDAEDAGGVQSVAGSTDDVPEYGDVVRLQRDILTADGRTLRAGLRGEVRAVYWFDEAPLVQIQLPGEFQCHGVSDLDIRVIDKVEYLVG